MSARTRLSVVIVDRVRPVWDCARGMHRPFWHLETFECMYCGIPLSLTARGAA